MKDLLLEGVLLLMSESKWKQQLRGQEIEREEVRIIMDNSPSYCQLSTQGSSKVPHSMQDKEQSPGEGLHTIYSLTLFRSLCSVHRAELVTLHTA